MKCEFKRPYRRRKLALTRANMLGAAAGIKLWAYRCPECGFWHLTHHNPSLYRQRSVS